MKKIIILAVVFMGIFGGNAVYARRASEVFDPTPIVTCHPTSDGGIVCY